jgi:hypothetical protein
MDKKEPVDALPGQLSALATLPVAAVFLVLLFQVVTR